MPNASRRILPALAAAMLAAALGLAAAPANAVPPSTLTVCAEGCDYTTIQAAVNAAFTGDVVSVAAGVYAETVTVAKGITIEGAGSGEDPESATILQGPGSGNGLTVTGTADDRAIVRDVRITGYQNGIVTGGRVTLERVSSTGNTVYGINLDDGTTALSIVDSAFDYNAAGLKLGSKNSASDITITGSSFDHNNGQGWYSDKNAATGSTLTNVSISDSTFNHNGDKGFYTEKLSDATFTRVEFSDSGNARVSQGSGLDLNLKYGDYENIVIVDVVAIDSGTASTPNGTGISIAARNDGSYASNPATLTGVSIEGGLVTGSVTGIAVTFDVDDVTIRDVDLAGNELAVRNQTPAQIIASPNWWGSPTPEFASLSEGELVTSPWWADAAMTVLGVESTPGDPVVVVPAEGPVVIFVEEGTDEPRLDLSALMDDDGVVFVEDGLTVSNGIMSLEIPAGTTITPSDPEWGSEFIPPLAVAMTSVTTPDGHTADVVAAVQVGSDEVSFTLDRAARIVLPGAAGAKAGFIAPGGTFTPITTECAADTQAAGDAVAADCFIAASDDLVVWTKHFTTFAAYALALPATGATLAPVWPAGGVLVLLGAGILGFAAYRRAVLDRR